MITNGVENAVIRVDDVTERVCLEDMMIQSEKMLSVGGLGLSVSYFIVTEDHGGEMGVHAAEAGGTRFVIRLPKTGRG